LKQRIYLQETEIIQNRRIKSNYYKLILKSLQIARFSQPGQFLFLEVSASPEPFLRRPFSIYRSSRLDGKIEILYKVVGVGTKILAQHLPGEKLSVLGPLGSGFKIIPQKRPLLVAGGIGLAGISFLAQVLRKRGKEVIIFLGAKTKHELIEIGNFRSLGCQIKLTTEDGSKGEKGKVSEVLQNWLTKHPEKGAQFAIYTCGPEGLLKEIAKICRQFELPGQASLESRLGCGLGSCLGCVRKFKTGYKRICQDGPVFKIEEIVFE
jgi:dihydroorotate dehydrogenase electron transfer subunit